MNTTEPLIDLGALLPIGAVAFVLWIVWSLYDAVFGGGNPLSRNTLARIEAGQKPETIYERWEQHRRTQRIVKGLLLAIVVLAFVVLAPRQATIIGRAIVESVSEITATVRRLSGSMEGS